MKDLSDKKLTILVQATHNADGYAILAARHRPGLMAFLLRLAGDDMNIDDIAQTAVIRAYERITQFNHQSSFKTWLFQIAYLEYLQLLRRRKVQNRLKENVAARQPPPTDVDPDVSIDIANALSTLTEKEKAAILLCDAHGFSHSEAAHSMGAPLGSVKTYVQRARQKMRRALYKKDLGDG